MAKKDLIGGQLWEQYSKKVAERMNNPINFGEIFEEEASKLNANLIIADYGAESCGDAVRLYWLVENATDKIIKAKFKSFGCGTAIAATDMMTEMCLGKTVDDVLKITNLDVEQSLRDEPNTPAVPPQKMHCSVMAYDVIKVAAAISKGVDLSEIENADIVCECAQVSLGTIQEIIRINNLTSVEEITDYTKAGAFCKSCIRPGGHESRKYYLEDILRDTRAEMIREERVKKEEDEPVDFNSLSITKKVIFVEKVIENHIRPKLARDGGGVELIDLDIDKDDTLNVAIKYMGVCKACPSSLTGTLSFVEAQLHKYVTNKLTVKVL